MSTDQERQARIAVTQGLIDQKTIKQLSSSGDAARANRPNFMARHVEEKARAQNQSVEGGNGGSGDMVWKPEEVKSSHGQQINRGHCSWNMYLLSKSTGKVFGECNRRFEVV